MIDELVMGNIAQPPEATNIARVIALKSGIPKHVPAVTVAREAPVTRNATSPLPPGERYRVAARTSTFGGVRSTVTG